MKGHIPLVWSLSQIHRTFDDMISLRQHLKTSVDYVCFSRPLENLTAAPRVVCFFEAPDPHLKDSAGSTSQR